MSWRDQALQHAQQEAPREACGLVVVVKGREVYRPCRNTAMGDDQFGIDPEDYAEAEDRGEVVAVVHSHPNGAPLPSEADLVGCEASGLEWHIVALPSAAWHSFKPTGYRAPLVGRQFVHGVLDCYAIVRDWYAQERGVTLPDFERHDDWWLRGGDLYRDNFRRAGFETCDELHPGAVLLMQIASPVPNHAAIYLGDDTILHHVHGRLSSRDVFGGYWRKATVMVLKHAGSSAVR
jgi:proteasome lid subunit RPN8/RPN11